MKSPTTYIIHCDLVDKEQNLLNGKPSTVLQTFDIKGEPYEKVFYQSGPEHVLRDVSADKHITNMALSVRDENNDLFDFNQEPLQFLLLFLFRFLRNETVLFWIRCELFTQWGYYPIRKTLVTTMSARCTKGKQSCKNMFFK